MKKIISVVLSLFIVLALSACEASYSESEMRRIRSDAYDNGYEDGMIDGRFSRFKEAYSLAQDLEEQINLAMIMIEEYPEYDLDDIYMALEQAREACHGLQSELYP